MQSFDAIVVGAGFSGISALYQLRQQGLSAKLFEKAPEVGGVWYWNKYQNAASDTPSELYRFSWDKDNLQTYPWPTHVLPQGEIQGYLKHIVDHYDLRQHIHFSSELKSASFNESAWTVKFSTGESFKATYLILAVGTFNKTVWPNFPGHEKFKGEQYHTGLWPEHRDLRGKRVGIVGTGSSGAQLLVGLADEAKEVVSFQRSAQYVVPNSKSPVPVEYRERVNKTYDDIWNKVRKCPLGWGYDLKTTKTFDVSAEEREKVFEAAWNSVWGFSMTFDTFADVVTDEAANREVCRFIQKKIDTIVKDPKKRDTLTPPAGALWDKRPVCCAGYYEAFNKENVDVVNFKKTPLVEITEKGIRTTEKEYELDVIVYATGYEQDGSWIEIDITGPNGKLSDKYAEGATAYLGVSKAGFPNLFFMIGPQTPLASIPSIAVFQGEFLTQLISKAEKTKKVTGKPVVVDTIQQDEDEWVKHSNAVAEATVFYKGNSYFFSDHNTPRAPKNGKRHVLWGLGGFHTYVNACQEALDANYRGFTFTS
ncbi:hypothetical protein M441DRAFT_162172 [Trichoderma asperellum CBS 433.97]|uniref:FAD/NAD(P)-binding domain-containing protein n=1 Tax=Trichoderma asperellum (strain ATCC 204424 / CBS 433.97 / NBRC 101777) TaxID=1042311 RepID=A0A2T3ZIQ2_TRIA4|nr:hypothetical protein M441DRAFT_162172 [Trichoderma asperellum CBS 433.97]PTB44687.1 hypothetical protein M441DRAFT_162172 [Trichoderma asperellum CBS 433.97]